MLAVYPYYWDTKKQKMAQYNLMYLYLNWKNSSSNKQQYIYNNFMEF
jgi:hypothetical protein